jgi:replicative DNA helicase Mcm
MLPEGADIDGIDVEDILSKTNEIKPVYSIEMLRKYVAYSKRIVPVMTPEANKIIQDSFLRIRNLGSGDSVPITARQLEGYVRLSEASAKMRLSNKITEQDANNAAELIEAYLNRIAGNGDGTYDIDKIATGVSSKDRSVIEIIKSIIVQYAGATGLKRDEVLAHAEKNGISEDDMNSALKKLTQVGDIYEPMPGTYKFV